MDILAHGLWGGFAIGWKKRFGLAFLFSVAPDVLWSVSTLIEVGVLFIVNSGDLRGVRFPGLWTDNVYYCTHSLIIIGAIWLVLWFTRRKIAIPFLAWPLHILIDILTHGTGRFPTLFLFPLSDYAFDGIRWQQHWFMIANYTGLLVVALAWIFYRQKKRKAESTEAGPGSQ